MANDVMGRSEFLIKKQLPTLVSILIGVIPIVILILYYDVPRKLIIGYGILSWITGVGLIKMPIYHFVVVKFLHKKLSHKWLGAVQGLVSAFSELGSAFIFFRFFLSELTLPQLIGFGVAAGAVESIVLPFVGNPLSGTPLEKHTGELEKKMDSNIKMQWMGVIERILALILHVFTRGLIYVSIITQAVFPGLIAIAAFGASDGRAYYALLEKWEFDNIKVLRKFYYYLTFIALILIISFFYYYTAL